MHAYLHRDIKPSNFAIGFHNQRKIYMFDYGLARVYMMNGKVREARAIAGFRGTVRYASLTAHKSKEMGRVDDLWSLFYIMLEFTGLQLPWKKIKVREEVGNLKEKTDHFELLEQCRAKDYNFPVKHLSKFLLHLQDLDYASEPDYEMLSELFDQAIADIGVHPDDPYDWEIKDKSKSVSKDPSNRTTHENIANALAKAKNNLNKPDHKHEREKDDRNYKDRDKEKEKEKERRLRKEEEILKKEQQQQQQQQSTQAKSKSNQHILNSKAERNLQKAKSAANIQVNDLGRVNSPTGKSVNSSPKYGITKLENIQNPRDSTSKNVLSPQLNEGMRQQQLAAEKLLATQTHTFINPDNSTHPQHTATPNSHPHNPRLQNVVQLPHNNNILVPQDPANSAQLNPQYPTQLQTTVVHPNIKNPHIINQPVNPKNDIHQEDDTNSRLQNNQNLNNKQIYNKNNNKKNPEILIPNENQHHNHNNNETTANHYVNQTLLHQTMSPHSNLPINQNHSAALALAQNLQNLALNNPSDLTNPVNNPALLHGNTGLMFDRSQNLSNNLNLLGIRSQKITGDSFTNYDLNLREWGG